MSALTVPDLDAYARHCRAIASRMLVAFPGVERGVVRSRYLVAAAGLAPGGIHDPQVAVAIRSRAWQEVTSL